MKLKDFTRYADSMKEVATEIAEVDLDRIRRAQQIGGIWQSSSPMLEMMKAQNQMNAQQSSFFQTDERMRLTTAGNRTGSGNLFSALGNLFNGL